MSITVVSTCPDCAAVVPAPAGVRVSSVVVCPACQAELELISLDPPEYALAPEIEEDFGE
ncbi:MAG: lysine biosynthesis protein LysW [Solirubrobacteraceae bacterium]